MEHVMEELNQPDRGIEINKENGTGIATHPKKGREDGFFTRPTTRT